MSDIALKSLSAFGAGLVNKAGWTLLIATLVALSLACRHEAKTDEDLFAGIVEHDMEKVNSSIKAGANVNLNAFDDWTPLTLAASKGDARIVSSLIQAGANVNKTQANGTSPLFWASSHGHLETVRILIQAGADPNKKCSQCTSPLRIALVKNHSEIAKVLTASGAKE